LAKPSSNPSLGQFLTVVEVGLVIFFLFFSESFNFAEPVSKSINFLNYIFLAGMIMRRWKRMAYVLSMDLSLLALIMFAVSSVFWSVDVDYSFRESIGMLRGTLFGVYLATCFTFKEHFKLFVWVALWAVVVNLIVCLILPDFGIAPDPNKPSQMAYIGIYPYKQILGRVMVLSFATLVVDFWRSPHRRWLSALGVIGSVFLLFAARSSTYQIAAIVAILMLPLHQIAKQGVKTRTVLFVITVMLGVTLSGMLAVNWETIVDSLGKDVTFNGRTPIWTLALEQWAKRPFLGYGYAAFWGSDEGLSVYRGVSWVWALHKHSYDIRTFISHNAFIDITLQLGIVGLTLLLFNIGLVMHRVVTLMTHTRSLESFWMLQLLVIQIIGGCFEISTYVAGNSISWVIYVAMAYASATLLHRTKRTHRTASIVALDSSPM
jgi:exopolysaccharide production protein ExoQ